MGKKIVSFFYKILGGKLERVNCAICGNKKNLVLIKPKDYRYGVDGQEYRLVKCKVCGLIYLNPRPAQNDIGGYYPDVYYESKFSLLENKINALISKIDTKGLLKLKKKGKLLDLGCGAGTFLSEMKKRGFDTIGVDVSKNACEITRKKGIMVYNGQLKSRKFPDNYFDIITLWHVFEHLPNPPETLREIRRILKKDGLLLMETPNINSLSFDIFNKYHFHLDVPRHLYHWSFDTMKKILAKNGFAVIQFESFSMGFPLTMFYSLKSFATDRRIKPPLSLVLTIISSPILIILTLFSRIIPQKGEILRVYAKSNK